MFNCIVVHTNKSYDKLQCHNNNIIIVAEQPSASC